MPLLPSMSGRKREVLNMFSFQALINEVVEKNSAYKSGSRDGAKFHISDAGKCYRERFYKRLGVEPTRTIETPALRKMLAGDAGHEKLQYLLRRYGKLFLAESELETEHIKGHPDGVIKNGVKALLEIKTIEKWGMGYIKKTGAKREHKLQMFTYWSLLRKELKDLDNAVLTYVKREDFESVDFNFIWSPEILDQVHQEWNPLVDYWLQGKLPPCTCKDLYDGAGPKYCRYGTSETECCDEKLYNTPEAKINILLN